MAFTHLKGLKQVLNPRLALQRIYKKTLQVTEKMPKESAYKINTEAIICYRLSVVNENEDVNNIEDIIQCGRIEMLVAQAQAEYDLSQKMIMWKPWKPLIVKPAPCQWKWPMCTD